MDQYTEKDHGLLQRDDANARFYGRPVSVTDLFQSKIKAPAAVRPLLQTLYAAEGRPEVMGMEQIPQGFTPGDTEITRDEAEALRLESDDVIESKGDEGEIEQNGGEHTKMHRVPPPFSENV